MIDEEESDRDPDLREVYMISGENNEIDEMEDIIMYKKKEGGIDFHPARWLYGPIVEVKVFRREFLEI